MEKKYVFFKMTSAPIVDSDNDTDKNSVECHGLSLPVEKNT